MAEAEYLFRRNPVWEALQAGRRPLRRLLAQEGAGQIGPILSLARQRGLPVETAAKSRLSQLAGDKGHQGVVLEAGPYPYAEPDEPLRLAAERGERPFLLLLDLLHGPHNIGLLLRTAEACGVHGVYLQARRAPDVTPQVAIASAGAAEHLRIAQVTNLAQTMRDLQRRGVWLAGLEPGPEARPLAEVDLDRSLGLVIGHEGGGLRRLVRQRCDLLLRLPMRGRVASLNAATAGAVALYAAWQARDFEGAEARPGN
ncbi:MAG: 23S rRNA (guanosine(2251)-2'-O)-methyltransferase RlmB [Candidatus Promineifilaceae bacterium]